MNELVEIAVIGGSGVYDSQLLTDAKQIKVHTPFGATSDLITVGTYAGRRVAFLPRHGATHAHAPHVLPARANIWALKQLGVKRILSPSAVGSLQEHIKPGELVIVDQFFDWTKGREYTFYNSGQVCHISTAHPFCAELREIAIESAKQLNIPSHHQGTTLCIEGPRFSTRAESIFFKEVVKADVIGMTLVPECVLAREMEICYLSIAAATDYDAWSDEPVSNQAVLTTMKKNLVSIKKLLADIIPKIPVERAHCKCHEALKDAMM